MLRYYAPTHDQRQVIRDLRYATKRAGLYRLDARARFKNARS